MKIKINQTKIRFNLKDFPMQFLNKEIEAKIKRKKSASLIKKQISCGIFQDLELMEMDSKKPQSQSKHLD